MGSNRRRKKNLAWEIQQTVTVKVLKIFSVQIFMDLLSDSDEIKSIKSFSELRSKSDSVYVLLTCFVVNSSDGLS